MSWNPYREYEALQGELRRLLAGAEGARGGAAAAWQPPLDIVETADAYLLVFDLPGVPQDRVGIEVDEGTLTIRGERPPREREGERLHRSERPFGPFGRAIPLPAGVDEGAIAADLRDGVLEVRVPKPAARQPRRIQISET